MFGTADQTMLPSMIQISPIAGGVIAGMAHVILGPDHLCTIVTLSACQGAEAFWFGVRWASGHLTGMAVIGTIVGFLNAAKVGNLDFEVYEHYAYYMVGFMLMGMGLYFILNADKYFDAEWAPKQASCACHAHPDQPLATNKAEDYGSGDEEAHHGHPKADKKVAAKLGLAQGGHREIGSVLVGFMQGIACPAGVVGMVFLKQYGPVEMVIFITIFFMVTTLAMGLLAMAYGTLTRSCVSSKVLGRSIYYASCGLSLSLGALWIILNATHNLDSLLGHDHDHGAHGHGHGAHDHGAHDHGEHAGHDHGHSHVHLLQEGGRLPDFLPGF